MKDSVDDKIRTIDGTIERVVFHNPGSGWTVLRVARENADLLTTVVGKFQKLSAGEYLRFRGRWIVDKRHGRQFSADTCLPISPATISGIEKFLGSGLIPGIGAVMAKRIVKHFGIDALKVIETDPKRVAVVQGIGPKRAVAIQKALVAKKAVQDVMVFLESAGISPTFALRIYKRYGNDSIRLVEENPYRLARDISGIGFASADKIASHLGVSKDSPHRAEAGLLHTMEEQASDGHVFVYQGNLVERASHLLQIDTVDLEAATNRLVLMGQIRREDGSNDEAHIYLPRLHRAETSIAHTLETLAKTPAKKLPINPADAIEKAQKESNMKLAPEQQQAFFAMEKAKIMVLTGGPGTGKTTLLRGLVSSIIRSRVSVLLAAPTGRAARRMAESTGRDALTLHRLLQYTPRTNSFERDAQNPLDADMVIVDEVSMVDVELFAALIRAIRPNARLVLVGDPNQLPSVGPGTVMSDLLALCGRVPGLVAVKLTQIFRQARSSLIITGAHDILAGKTPHTGEKGSGADLFLIERKEASECLETIKDLVSKRIPKSFGFDPIDDVQVLTPMHKGVIGATNLNSELQTLLNPHHGGISSGHYLFNQGDKVMQIRNNYDLEVFNGDIGKITAVGEEKDWIEVTYPEKKVRYPASELDQIVLAYACSVHKSQGSEYPVVVIPIHTQHFVMLQRNLLYTAITRGKRLVVVVGSKRALSLAAKNAKQTARNSSLIQRVLSL